MSAVLQFIKPGDLVETPRKRTARCVKVNHEGSREFEDVVTGERFNLFPRLVRLLMPSVVKRWTSHKL
jgi:hypothetical protein